MRVIALRHVAFEGLGVWASTLRSRGHLVEYLEAGDDLSRANAADLLVVLGAPIGVGDTADYPYLADERAVIASRLDEDRPTIGVCLGAQLMAAALGASVYAGERQEIGWGRLALTAEANSTPLRTLVDAPVLHWHGDTFDLPAGATLLASSGITRNQAFSVGRSLALQFHCEVEGGAIERWLVGHAVELAGAEIDIGRLRLDSARHALAAARAGRALIEEYLDALGTTGADGD
jgi:GMP synthase (glutamine-hydrolysing)